MTFRCGVSPDRNVRGVTTVSAFASITATRCRACDCQGSTVTFLNRSTAASGSPFSVSKIAAMANWACAAGSLPGNLLSSGSQAAIGLVVLLLRLEALADLEEDARHARVERVLRQERLPGGAGLVVPLGGEVVGGDQELGVEDARWASALWGPLGYRAR